MNDVQKVETRPCSDAAAFQKSTQYLLPASSFFVSQSLYKAAFKHKCSLCMMDNSYITTLIPLGSPPQRNEVEP